MSIYDANGNELRSVYDKNGELLSSAYDLNGNKIFNSRDIVFEDDFNGSELDETKWTKVIGTWIATQNNLNVYREQNTTIEDSCLVFTAKKENYANKTWTSGAVTGQLKQNILYGRIEAKIKFPNLVGAFAAFWMVGSNFWKEFVDDQSNPINHGVIWPKCGEIDIDETIPGNASIAQANLWSYSGSSMGGGSSGTLVSSLWHIYACEWTPDYIAMFVDDVEYKRWTFSDYSSDAVQAYHLPFYILLNLAIGTSGGTPSESTTEMKMYVDWVRVYAPLTA